jgi:predicted nucleotidyltransferase
MNLKKNNIDVMMNIYSLDLSALSKDIIRTLLYFDIFRWPLKEEDLFINSSIPDITKAEMTTELERLSNLNYIRHKGDYYFLGDNDCIEKRDEANAMASRYLPIARKMSGVISWFPYVRGIYLSGSLSKGYFDKDSDIDYFIITSPGRLWLCRTVLILFKKIFLLNSKKYFCLNYFIDTDHLEIPDKNMFTACELNYLLPTYNEILYEDLMNKNKWRLDFNPNVKLYSGNIIPLKKNTIKSFIEKMFLGWLGNKLDDLCMNLTSSFWKWKYRNIQQNDDVKIRCKKYVSKYHPRNFQINVLAEFQNKVSFYEQEFDVKIK